LNPTEIEGLFIIIATDSVLRRSLLFHAVLLGSYNCNITIPAYFQEIPNSRNSNRGFS